RVTDEFGAFVEQSISVTITGTTDVVSVAVGSLLLANDPNAVYGLLDTSVALLNPADQATVTQALSVTVTNPVSVADAEALLLLNSNTTYDIADTAAAIAAASVGGVESGVISGAGTVTATTDALAA